MGLFSDSKDMLVTSMGLPMLNRSLLAPYGKATNLRLDSTNKTAEVILELHGEKEPVRIEIQRYELQREGDDLLLVVHAIKTSREWLTALAQNQLVGRPLKMPPQAASMLSRFL